MQSANYYSEIFHLYNLVISNIQYKIKDLFPQINLLKYRNQYDIFSHLHQLIFFEPQFKVYFIQLLWRIVKTRTDLWQRFKICLLNIEKFKSKTSQNSYINMKNNKKHNNLKSIQYINLCIISKNSLETSKKIKTKQKNLIQNQQTDQQQNDENYQQTNFSLSNTQQQDKNQVMPVKQQVQSILDKQSRMQAIFNYLSKITREPQHIGSISYFEKDMEKKFMFHNKQNKKFKQYKSQIRKRYKILIQKYNVINQYLKNKFSNNLPNDQSKKDTNTIKKLQPFEIILQNNQQRQCQDDKQSTILFKNNKALYSEQKRTKIIIPAQNISKRPKRNIVKKQIKIY